MLAVTKRLSQKGTILRLYNTYLIKCTFFETVNQSIIDLPMTVRQIKDCATGRLVLKQKE
jgi:hypothetical protein